MIKFTAKCIIVLLALQSAMNYLRKEEIIEGSIEINYETVTQKLLAAVPIKKIGNGIVEFGAEKIQSAVVNHAESDYQIGRDRPREERRDFKIVEHVVDRGETLAELAQRYGVHWRVIQRLNHLGDEHKLLVGQRLKIPSRMHQLI